MRTQEVAIKSTPLRVILKPDAEVLQEVVVTGMQKTFNLIKQDEL